MISPTFRRNGFSTGSAAAALLLGIGPSLAQEGAVLLDTVIVEGNVTATGDEGGPAVDTPLASRVERDVLEKRSIESFEDLGRRVDAGVNFNGASNSINLRGLDEDRVLTTIDGIRLPWIGDGARGVQGGLQSVDFDTLSALDIVRGADSSLFGSGALGGVVVLRTLNPEDLLQDGRRIGSLSKLQYDSADESWQADAAVAMRAGETFALIQGGYQLGHEFDNQGTAGGIGADRTEPNPLDSNEYNLLAKLHHYVEGDHRFGITGELFSRKEDIDLLTGQGPGTSYAAGEHEAIEAIERQRVSLSYDYKPSSPGPWLDQAEVVAYWQRQTLASDERGLRTRDARANIIPRDPFRYGFPNGPYGRDNEIEETSIGTVGSATRSFDIGGLSHEVTLGGEVYGTDTRQFSSGFDNCPDYAPGFPQPFGPQSCIFLKTNQADMPEVKGTNAGFFVQDEIGFHDGRVRLTPGLRVDWYERDPQATAGLDGNSAFGGSAFDGELPSSSSDAELSPKILAEWDLAPDATLYAQYAQAFRAPTATELYLTFGGAGSYLIIGNPDLKPETSNGFEVGARLGDETLGGSISLFDNYYENFIDEVGVDPASIGLTPGEYPLGITRAINRDEVRIYGAEARLHWAFAPQWRAWGSVAYYNGRDTGRDVYLNSIPPLRGIVGLGYAADRWGADLSLTAAAARDDVENPETDFKAPGYEVVDLTAWWEPERFEGMRLQAGVFNLFDETYYDVLEVPDRRSQPDEFYSEPGRSVRASLTYKF